jgi:tRNA pseudouridine38-40 synthase
MVTKLTIEYDGTRFAGWARQPGERTVEGELERALRTVLGEPGSDGAPLRLTVAGRTDRGVHAWGQVASYAHEAVDPMRLNGLLDDDVAVLAAEPAPPGFDARRDATSRTYCYRVLARRNRSAFERGRAYWWRGRLDRVALAECARALLGRHDFTAFTPSETEHSWFQRDVLQAEWRGNGNLLEFWIEADTFMRHMNRVLVGTMLDVGSGLSTVEDFRGLLDGGTRAQAGRTAPAHGLALAHVSYARETHPPARARGDGGSRAAPGAGPAIGGRSGPYAG